MRFSAETDSLVKGLDKAQKAIAKQNQAYDRLAKDAAIKGAAITGAFALMVDSATKYGEQVDKISKQTGIATDVISSLGYAAQQEHASMQGLADGLKFLSRNMDEAAMGGKQQKEAFDRLGISLIDAQGKMKSVDTVLLEVADAMKGAGDEAAKTNIAMTLFGRSGAELVPFLQQGSDGIKTMQNEARDLGIELDTETTRSFKAFRDETDKLKGAFQGFQVTVVKDVLPAFAELTQKATDLVVAYKQIPEPIRRIGSETTLMAGAFFGALAVATKLKSILSGFGALGKFFGPILAGFAALRGIEYLASKEDPKVQAAEYLNALIEERTRLEEQLSADERQYNTQYLSLQSQISAAQAHYNSLIRESVEFMGDEVAARAKANAELAKNNTLQENSLKLLEKQEKKIKQIIDFTGKVQPQLSMLGQIISGQIKAGQPLNLPGSEAISQLASIGGGMPNIPLPSQFASTYSGLKGDALTEHWKRWYPSIPAPDFAHSGMKNNVYHVTINGSVMTEREFRDLVVDALREVESQSGRVYQR